MSCRTPTSSLTVSLTIFPAKLTLSHPSLTFPSHLCPSMPIMEPTFSIPSCNLSLVPLISCPYLQAVSMLLSYLLNVFTCSLFLLSSFMYFFPLLLPHSPLNLYLYFFSSFLYFSLFCPTLFLSSVSLLPTSSALRSCSTGDSLLSSAFIRSAKSAPALAPPLPVLLHHHHHPLLPPLADQLAGTHSLHYLSACLLPACLD